MYTVAQAVSEDEVAPPSSDAGGSELRLFKIVWRDIIACSGWEPHEEVEVPSMISVGWLVHTDDDVVKIANTLWDGVGYGITAFPRGCITSMEAVSAR